MGDTFYSNGLRFSCVQCSACCRHDPGYVYLSKIDLQNLCNITNVTKKDFIEKYCRVVPYHDGTEVLSLQEKKNYDCIFWNNGCGVYSARPIQCSTYPFWTFLLKSQDSWNKESESCPGINKGKLLNENDICVILNRYKQNIPIRFLDNECVEDLE